MLDCVSQNKTSVSDAINELQHLQSADLGYAKVDLSRKARNGYPEVIYGAGKTAEQIIEIMHTLKKSRAKMSYAPGSVLKNITKLL